MWEWKLDELPSFEDILKSKVSKVYNWHKVETESLVRAIIEKRVEKQKSKKFKSDPAILAEIASCTETICFGK